MTATADSIIERRQLRKRLALWRIGALVALVVIGLMLLPEREATETREHVARLAVDGVILNDADRLRAIRKAGETDSVRALIVTIASPGGTVVGSEALFDELRRVADTKPVVAVVGEMAASGGYIAALAADRIFVRRNSITGSIGVIGQIPDYSDLMEKVGVSITEIRSTPLKAAPSPFEPHDPAALDAIEDMLLDSYGWFTGLVSERRGLEGEALDAVIDGRVHTGARALELGLVDALGDETAARDWLAETHGIDKALPVRELRWGRRELPYPFDLVDEIVGGTWMGGLRESPLVPTEGPRIMALWTG